MNYKPFVGWGVVKSYSETEKGYYMGTLGTVMDIFTKKNMYRILGLVSILLVFFTIVFTSFTNSEADIFSSGGIDDTKGNGDTTYTWSADKIYDQLALKQMVNKNKTDETTAKVTVLVASKDPRVDALYAELKLKEEVEEIK